MKLTLIRKEFTEDYTMGELYIDDAYFCNTLELTTRKLEKASDKVPGKTAIPFGLYQVKLTYSNHFKRILPEILNVLFFKGVRFHEGNTIKDIRGCIAVGKKVGAGVLAFSRKTTDELVARMKEENEITLEIVKE